MITLLYPKLIDNSRAYTGYSGGSGDGYVYGDGDGYGFGYDGEGSGHGALDDNQ